jgi:hypothetical protein
VISSDLTMSTPEPISVASVREKRAIVTLRTTSPIFIGMRSFSRSQTWRPRSVFFARRTPQIEKPTTGKMMNQSWRSRFDAFTICWVRVGSCPFSCLKTLTKIGDDEHEEPGQHERREDQDDDRVDHRALHPAFDRSLLLDLHRDAVEHLVERPRRLARLDHRDEEPVEHTRVPSKRLREDRSRLDVAAHVGDHGTRNLSSVCSSRIASALTMLTPASISVANWREKT